MGIRSQTTLRSAILSPLYLLSYLFVFFVRDPSPTKPPTKMSHELKATLFLKVSPKLQLHGDDLVISLPRKCCFQTFHIFQEHIDIKGV